MSEDASKILHAVYDVGLLIEKMAKIGDMPQSLRALAYGSVGLCQAILCETRQFDSYERDAIADLDQRLASAEATLLRKGSPSAKHLGSARTMLGKALEDFAWRGVGA
jgi:hypothetical protein